MLEVDKSRASWALASSVPRLCNGFFNLPLAALAALPLPSLPLHVSHSTSLFSRSNSELVGISIAQSNQQKDQLLLAFEFHRGTFNHHSFSNRTFRFARQYNGPTKPSPAPRTLRPDPELKRGFFSKQCIILHAIAREEELSCA